MKNVKSNLVAFILPVTILSTQGAVSMQNNVTTTGNSDVHVESSVTQSSTHTTNIHVSNSANTTANNSDTKTHTKMEVTINGKTKKLETDEPGNHILDMNEETATSSATLNTTKPIEAVPIAFTGKTISVGDYIKNAIQNVFRNFFSLFGRK